MSTEIKSLYGVTLTIRPGASGSSEVQITASETHGCIYPRAEFLAAVEAECGVRLVPADAIVIDRADVPAVTRSEAGSPKIGDITWCGYDASLARRRALEHLALAEYLDAHPPVDEAQVEALATAIDKARVKAYLDNPYGQIADIARDLYLAGVRIEAAK